MFSVRKDLPCRSGWHWRRETKALQVLFLYREKLSLSQTQNTFLHFKVEICVGKSKHFIKYRCNDVLWQMLSPGNSTFALSPVGRKKPATLLVPEPRNCAKTQATASQEKRSAAVRGLRQSRPVVVKRDCKRDLWCSWGRSWDLLVESAGSRWLWTRFTTSRSCVVESRVKSAKGIFQGVWDSLGQPVLNQPGTWSSWGWWPATQYTKVPARCQTWET